MAKIYRILGKRGNTTIAPVATGSMTGKGFFIMAIASIQDFPVGSI